MIIGSFDFFFGADVGGITPMTVSGACSTTVDDGGGGGAAETGGGGVGVSGGGGGGTDVGGGTGGGGGVGDVGDVGTAESRPIMVSAAVGAVPLPPAIVSAAR